MRDVLLALRDILAIFIIWGLVAGFIILSAAGMGVR